MALTAGELDRWLRGLHAVPEPSVDWIIVGAPDATARGIAVVWMPTWAALRTAAERGCNVVVAHEPTFFNHHDEAGFDREFAPLPPRARASLESTRDAKRRWLEENRMVVIRCHDVLDAMPGGVVDSLARGLGFSPADCVTEWNRYRVMRVTPAVSAHVLAQRLAAKFAQLGQPGLAFYGDPQRRVSSLGLGTGYGCEPWHFVELGADMGVTIDDRIKTWCEGEWAEDSGFPLAVVHHGASEEWGVRRLAEILTAQWQPLPVQLIPQGFNARWITKDVPT